MGEPEKGRTTIELLKKPDLDLLRNLKASLTLKFNTEISYRDAILYLFASRVLGTKSVNAFIDELRAVKFKGNFSETLNKLIDILNARFREELLAYWEDEVRKFNKEYISYCESASDSVSHIVIKKDIANVKRREKEFLEALKKIEKAETDVLWKV